MTDRTDTVLNVPHYNADGVRERIAKFTRWCVREGMPSPTVTEAPCTVRRTVVVDGRDVQVDVPGVAFTVATALLRLPGDWRLAAVVTPTDGGLVTTHAPGAPVVPADVIGDGTRCDHCECRRHRIETFAVVDDAGAFRMVGRNCVRAYLGVDPARWATYLLGYAAALNVDEDGEPRDYAPGAGARWTDDVHRVLAAALFILRERGAYFKRDPDGKRPTPSTSSEAAELLNPYPVLAALAKCRDAAADREAARLLARVRAFEVDAANAMRALDARRWAASTNAGASPLDADMRAIASTGCVPPRSFGTTCWMAAAYLRANGELGEAKRDRPVRTDAHVGAEGERVDLPGCTVVHASQHDTAYGTSTLLVGYTADGRRWKCWYSGSGDVPAKGQRCDVRATIKANGTDDRDGTKVSTLTRAKFTSIADVDPAPAGDVAVAA